MSLKPMEEKQVRIKRPMNSFMVWSRVERRRLALKHPNLLNYEISKLLGDQWNRLSESEKLPFCREAERLRSIHREKYPDFTYRPRKNSKTKSSMEDSRNKTGPCIFGLPPPQQYKAPRSQHSVSMKQFDVSLVGSPLSAFNVEQPNAISGHISPPFLQPHTANHTEAKALPMCQNPTLYSRSFASCHQLPCCDQLFSTFSYTN